MKFIKKFAPFLFVPFIAVSLYHSNTRLATSQENKTFVWQIKSPNNTVYLLGSIHLLKPEDYPLPEQMQAAFADAENVFFEINIGDLVKPETISTILKKAMPDSREELLTEALSPENYKLASEAASKLGLSLENFKNFEPWFLAMSLSTQGLMKLGYDPNYGVDSYFYNRALQAGKDVFALETIEEQFDIFDNLSPQTQKEFVRQTILELDILESSLAAMVELWRIGDADRFQKLIFESLKPYPELEDKILARRNQKWMVELEPLINQNEDYLIVVGAAHLVGQDGLVEQFQQKGYSVRQF